MLEGFGHKVCAGVPISVFTAFVLPFEEFNLGVFVERSCEVPNGAVDFGRKHFFGQSGADAFGYLHRGRSLCKFFYGVIRECDFYHYCYLKICLL